MDHVWLDAYRVALEVARWMVRQSFPRGLADLKNQGVRAAASVVLNIAEGSRRRGKARANHYEIARGSAAEALAVLMIVEVPGSDEAADKLRRVDRMLQRMGGDDRGAEPGGGSGVAVFAFPRVREVRLLVSAFPRVHEPRLPVASGPRGLVRARHGLTRRRLRCL